MRDISSSSNSENIPSGGGGSSWISIAGFWIDARQSHVKSALRGDLQRLDGPRGTDQRTEVAVLVAARVIEIGHRGPQALPTVLQPRRVQNRPWTDFEALGAPNAEVQEQVLRHAAWRPQRADHLAARRTSGDPDQGRSPVVP